MASLLTQRKLLDVQAPADATGPLMGPISPTNNPASVDGEYDLTQAVAGPNENASYTSRGFVATPAQGPFNGPATPVSVGLEAPRPAAVVTPTSAPTPAATSVVTPVVPIATATPPTPKMASAVATAPAPMAPTVPAQAVAAAPSAKAAAPTASATAATTAPTSVAASGRKMNL